jgi:hypothetical protein
MTGYTINAPRGRQATIESMQADAEKDKMNQKSVEYGDGGMHPYTDWTAKGPKESKREEYCRTCRYFAEPKPSAFRCSLVRNPIRKDGWCRYWTPGESMTTGAIPA